ncbi:MAG TPA: sulfotransferase [Verrucomicrobiales bacterium]|nr:sulfotransferase [Verrucomicrobiales bacterium]
MKRRLHIVGCPRSGTTLLLEMLGSCFANAGRCEHELDLFQNPQWSDGVFVSKQPSDIRSLRRVFLADPALFVIYVVRDPRAVVASVHASRPDRYFVDYAEWKYCQDAAERLRGHARFLELRFEDLVRDPDTVQARIEDCFPWLERLHAFSEYHRHAAASEASRVAMHGMRPVDSGRVESWRQHLPRICAQARRYPSMVEDLIRAGYESDGGWVKELDGVKPLLSPRRHRSWFGLRQLETRLRKWRKTRTYLRRLRAEQGWGCAAVAAQTDTGNPESP